MRFVLWTLIFILLLVAGSYFITINLNPITVNFPFGTFISGPIGALVLVSLLLGVVAAYIWFSIDKILSFFKLSTRQSLINRLIELYKNTSFFRQALSLSELGLAQKIAKQLKSPHPDLDYFVEIEKIQALASVDEKLKKLEELRAKTPVSPYLILEIVACLLKQKNVSVAFNYLDNLNQLSPTVSSLKKGIEIAIELEDFEKAKNWLNHLHKLGIEEPELEQQVLETELYHRFSTGQDITSQAKQLLKKFPSSLLALELLAKHFAKTDPSLAAKYLRTRAEMANNYSFWRDLIEFLVQNNFIEQAIEVNKYASENLPDPHDRLVAQVDLARLLLSSGNLNEAMFQLNKVLDSQQSALVQISVEKLAKLYIALVNLKRGSTLDTLRTLDSILVG